MECPVLWLSFVSVCVGGWVGIGGPHKLERKGKERNFILSV